VRLKLSNETPKPMRPPPDVADGESTAEEADALAMHDAAASLLFVSCIAPHRADDAASCISDDTCVYTHPLSPPLTGVCEENALAPARASPPPKTTPSSPMSPVARPAGPLLPPLPTVSRSAKTVDSSPVQFGMPLPAAMPPMYQGMMALPMPVLGRLPMGAVAVPRRSSDGPRPQIPQILARPVMMQQPPMPFDVSLGMRQPCAVAMATPCDSATWMEPGTQMATPCDSSAVYISGFNPGAFGMPGGGPVYIPGARL